VQKLRYGLYGRFISVSGKMPQMWQFQGEKRQMGTLLKKREKIFDTTL
jgi:hypothetical protein